MFRARYRAGVAVVLLLLALPAFGADKEFARKLEEGNRLLREGNYPAALSAFQELESQDPNSPEVQFGLGCAQYNMALQQEGATQEPDAAQEQLNRAREAFERATASANPQLKSDAGYNRANALAQKAKTAPVEDPKALTESFNRSIGAYESFLRQHPNHALARHNLDHMRYILKRQQQQPPQQQQQGQQGEDPNKNEGQQDQQGGSGQQQDQDQQGDQSQSDDSQDSQDQNSQQNDGENQQDPSETGQEGDSQEGNNSDSASQMLQSQQKAILGEAPPSGQNVDAILESLEERDHLEQRNMRRGERDKRVRKEWW